jgi:hypothetical protein
VRAKCRFEAELLAKKAEELRALAKLEKDREERGHADELAGAMNEFFEALYVSDMVDGFDNRMADAEASGNASGSAADLPLASPDSITVTTSFGVVEESANVTVISASGPSPHHQVFDTDTEDENNVEMTEDLHEDLPELQPSLSPLTHATEVDVQVDVSIETMQDVSDNEADVDTDADVESAVLDEFIDDVDDAEHAMLTPTTTILA